MPYQRNQDVKTTLMPDGHIVLFNTKTEWAQVVNPVGALVWELCDGITSEEEMVKQIGQLLQSSDSGSLKDDIRSLIDELLDLDLLQLSQPGQVRQSL